MLQSSSEKSPKFWRRIIGRVTSGDLVNGHASDFVAVHFNPNFAKGSIDSNIAILQYGEPIDQAFGPLSPNTFLPVCVPQISAELLFTDRDLHLKAFLCLRYSKRSQKGIRHRLWNIR